REHDAAGLELPGRQGHQGDLLLGLRHAVRARGQGMAHRAVGGDGPDGQGQGRPAHGACGLRFQALLLVLSGRQAHLQPPHAKGGRAIGEAGSLEARPPELRVPAVLLPGEIHPELGLRRVHEPHLLQLLGPAYEQVPPRAEGGQVRGAPAVQPERPAVPGGACFHGAAEAPVALGPRGRGVRGLGGGPACGGRSGAAGAGRAPALGGGRPPGAVGGALRGELHGGERIKWACVNWYGPQSEKYVVGGLEVAPLGEIVERIVAFGFNCVRLPYCTQAHVDNPVVQDEDVFANPQFQGGRRFLEVWDATVEALTSAGLMVIINNHLHVCGWCCYYAQDEGLWYVPGFPESVWIESLVNMTERHQNDSMVVAMDLRNEVHDYEDTWLTWGDGNEKTDWAAAATRAGNAVLRANSNIFHVVMALCSGMDLRGAIDSPINLSVSRRLVLPWAPLQSHNYVEFQWWAYVSANVVSWKTVQVASAFAGLLFSFATWLLLRAWRALAMPRPPRSAWLAVAGAWWLAACALCAGGAGAIWLVMTRLATPAAGRRDVLPAIVSSCALASVGVALLGAACLDARAARRGSAAPARKVAAAVGELVAARPAPFALGRARPGSGMDDLAATPARPEQVVLEVPSACRQQPAGAPAVCCEPGCSACGLAWARPARPCGGREEHRSSRPRGTAGCAAACSAWCSPPPWRSCAPGSSCGPAWRPPTG
ncbi:unnamed protein product, partial [Prorocentrum cordatum]